VCEADRTRGIGNRRGVVQTGQDCLYLLTVPGKGVAATWDGDDKLFAYHNAWHAALFHMDRAEYAPALAVFDARLATGGETALQRIDATGLLWRLMLEGVDVRSRFIPIAEAWERALDDEGGFYAFNDFFATLAFAGAGRRETRAQAREALARGVRDGGANADMTRHVARPACEAAIDYIDGRYAEATEKLAAVRDGAWRFGGSNAQRDLLALTLIDAATRAGLRTLARHYANERLVHKPSSAWGPRLLARI
jgi:hypothetical protein